LLPASDDKFTQIARSSLVQGKNAPPKKISQLASTDKIVSIVDTDTTLIESRKTIAVPLGYERGITEIEFVVEVIDRDGFPIEAIVRRARVADELRQFQTPKLGPIVGDVNFNRGKAYVQVKQRDLVATGVQIWRKTLRMHEAMLDNRYEFVGTFPVMHGEGFKKFAIDVVGITPQIFRVIPVGPGGTVGSEFSNCVAAPDRVPNKSRQPRANRMASCIFIGEIVDGGVSLEAFKVEFGPIALRFLRRDLTLHERTFSQITSQTGFQQLSHGTSVAVTDSAVTRGHTYEYTVEFVYPYGETSRFGSFVIEFVPLSTGTVDTKVSELESVVVNGIPNVRFKLSTTTLSSVSMAVTTAISRENLINKTQVGTTATQSPNVTGFRVVRVNLTTGDREDLGTIADGTFDDSKQSVLKGAKSLNENHVYRYQVSTLVRQASTMLIGGQTTATDSSAKAFTTQDWKFKHPIATQRGNLVTATTLKTSYAKDDMEFGNVGDMTTVDVSFETQNAGVEAVTVQRIDRGSLLVQWSVTGDHKLFDHFLVFREIMGLRSYVGKCHANFSNNDYRIYHTLTRDDEGLVQYIVKPILNNYAESVEKSSNEIEVDF
jgi:hypothetical protein